MSRQMQTNSFGDGLNKDTNSLLTPNTVMTDCLNGTIVTYNGNEFALQNDLGNYKFKYGSLDFGYVPVGMKEHANILYIVSYNPIEDKVQIGSFPSMKTISSSDIKVAGNPTEIELSINGVFTKYSDIANNSQLVLLSTVDKDNMLNPGDQYILLKSDDNTANWQHTSVYILTENNKLYNIDEFIKYSNEENTYSSSDFNYVDWDIPGYMAIKTTASIMDEFNCYVSDFGETSTTIQVQTIWNESYDDQESIDYLLNNLIFKYYPISKGSNQPSIEESINEDFENGWKTVDSQLNKTDFGGLGFSLYNNFNIEKFGNDTNSIAIVPLLKIKDGESDKYIVYDTFYTTVSLEKSSFDKNSIQFGDDEFNYNVNDKYITMSFNVNSSSDTILLYQFSRYRKVGNNSDLYKVFEHPILLEGINYSGLNTFNINFYGVDAEDRPLYKHENEFSDGIYDENKNYNPFDKEDIYKLEIYLAPKGYVNSDNIKDFDFESNDIIYKTEYIIYATEIINGGIGKYKKFNSDTIADSISEGALSLGDYEISEEGQPYYAVFKNDDSISEDQLNYESTISTLKSILEGMGLVRWADREINDVIRIEFGNKYKISGGDVLYPKNQRNKIGNIWKNAKSKVSAKSGNISFDESHINAISYFEATPNYNDTKNIHNPIPTQENNVSWDRTCLEYKDGWYKIKAMRVIRHDYKGGDDLYNYTIPTYKYPICFQSISSTEINIYFSGTAHDTNCKLTYQDGNWILDKYHFWTYFNAEYLLGWSEHEGFKMDLTANEVSRRFNNSFGGPSLVLFYNNLDVSNTYYKTDKITNVGFDSPRLYTEREETTNINQKVETRRMFGIALPRNDADGVLQFVMLQPSNIEGIDAEYNTADITRQYVLNVLGTYMMLVDSLRFCNYTSESSTVYYHLSSPIDFDNNGFTCNYNIKENVHINGLNCNFTINNLNVNSEYEGFINAVQNKTFTYINNSINKYLSSEIDDSIHSTDEFIDNINTTLFDFNSNNVIENELISVSEKSYYSKHGLLSQTDILNVFIGKNSAIFGENFRSIPIGTSTDLLKMRGRKNAWRDSEICAIHPINY